jgi:hypothetical protein
LRIFFVARPPHSVSQKCHCNVLNPRGVFSGDWDYSSVWNFSEKTCRRRFPQRRMPDFQVPSPHSL